MTTYASSGHEQATFETAVSSSASIVKPTVPKNVLAEFELFAQTGNRFKKANPFDDDPVQQAPPPPLQPVYQAPPPQETRRQAPLPPVQQQQRPVDFSGFGDFTISKAAPAAPLNQKPADDEKSRLVEAMQQHLRLKAAYGQAMTVGELSAQIREITGQSWGGYWEGKYGNLMVFLKNNPDAFTVIKSKYVTCRGQEDVAHRQIDREAQEQFEQQQRMQQSQMYPPPPSQMQTSYFAPSFDDPFGLNQQSMMAPPPQQPITDFSQITDPWGGQQSRSNSVISRRDSNEWVLPSGPGASSFDPFAPIDPFRQAEAPSYIPHAQNTSVDWWGASQLPPRPQQQHQDTFNMSTLNQSLPMETSTASGLSAEEEKAIRKAEKKAAKDAKKQEEEDERLARELQNKEFESSQETESVDTGETVVLTTAQMRDLAEKELGIDNVRIIAGFTVKKYGREGRPHQRKMWVTQSLTHLAWASSLLEGSHRGIELKHVTEVTAGQMTPTIARTTSDKKKVQAQCFSLVTMSRTLDMQACSIIQRDALVNALRAVVAFNHKYKPEKVDRDLTRIKLLGNAALIKGKA